MNSLRFNNCLMSCEMLDNFRCQYIISYTDSLQCIIMGSYTVKSLYNDFIILQVFFLCDKLVFLRFSSDIWYYLQFIAIYPSSPFGALLSNRRPKKHVLWPVQHLVFIANLDPGWKQTKSQLTVWTLLMTQCPLQLWLCLFCNQTRCFIYGSGEAPCRECSYI